jgi:1,4-dihydroxy-2-naphthoate octaprenyltransferase
VRDRLRLIFLSTRPFSLTAAAIPVIVGTLVAARDQFSLLRFLLAFGGAVAIQAGTNLVNDYYDHVKGVDGSNTLGPAGMIQRGTFSARAILLMGIGWFALGSAIGLLLVAMTGPELLWLGLASVAAGFFYTAAPVSLAYLGLGELTVFLFMGPVIVTGAYYVQTETWSWTPVIVSLPIAFLVTAILHANNLRDIDNDRAHGKRTIATLIGRRAATVEYELLMAATYLALLVVVVAGAAPWPVLLAAITVPAAVTAVRLAARTTNPKALNFVLFRTAMLHRNFGLLMSAGLAIGVVWDRWVA